MERTADARQAHRPKLPRDGKNPSQRRFPAALVARLRLSLATNDRASPIPIGSARETRAPRLEQRARGTRDLVT